MKRYLVVTLALFSGVTNVFSQFVETSNPEKDRPQQQPVVIRPLTHPQGLSERSFTSTRSFYKSKADWQKIIDSTWGPGLPLVQKLEIFDTFSSLINDKFDGFLSLGINWDSLRTLYRSKIDSTTSKGGFAAIMSKFAMSLRDGHTEALDTIVTFTPLAPGIPILILNPFSTAEHFGAVLTALPDSSAVVLYTVPNHPLGLVPGDIILGYELKPWKLLVKELLTAELPVYTSGIGASSAITHALMRNAGNNWHLFDTIDVLKYSTKDTLHLSVLPLLALSSIPMQGFEQLEIPGIPFAQYIPSPPLGFNIGQQMSSGKLPGTNIGYIQLICEWPTEPADESFYQAINALWNTEGLVIDMRWNPGGWALFDQAFAMMFSERLMTIEDAHRAGPTTFNLVAVGNSNTYVIPGAPGSIYDKPIAVLLGPTCVSMGDLTAQRLRYHPMVRFFGKPLMSSFGDNTYLKNFKDWFIQYSFGDMFHTSQPGVYLNRREFPIDEPVWFNPDDVAKGKDPVLIRAQEWMKGLSHIYDFTVVNPYVRPGIDSLVVTGILNNPAKHTMSAQVTITNSAGIVLDSALMKNDGLHGDGLPDDSVWGAYFRAPSAEEFYTLNESVMDQTLGSMRQLPALKLFTTAGPLKLDSLGKRKIASAYLVTPYVRNSGKTLPVGGAIVNLRSNDPWVKSIAQSSPTLPVLSPGVALPTDGPFSVSYDATTFPGYFNFNVDISVNGMIYWTEFTKLVITGVGKNKNTPPTIFSLEQNYPNPFNPSTTIRYSLPSSSRVKLYVYNILGQVVSDLVNEEQSAGWKEVEWNASGVSSGIYFYKLTALQKDGGQAGSFVEVKKMLLVK